jgi:hypothetical protein
MSAKILSINVFLGFGSRCRIAVHHTMVSVNGIRKNASSNDIQSVVTLDDFFRDD